MDLWDISVQASEVITLPKSTSIPFSSPVIEEIFEIKRWKYLGHEFKCQYEFKALKAKFPSAKIIEIKDIWDEESVAFVNKHALEYEKAFLYKPWTSNPYKFIYYLICFKKRSERYESANIVNLIPKIERILKFDIGRARYLHKNETMEFMSKRDEMLNDFIKQLKL